MLEQLMTMPMTIERAGSAKDRYGNANIDWTNPTSTPVLGWYDANVKRFQHEDGRVRDEAASDGIVYLPAGTDVLSTDRLLIGTDRYEVFGVPAVIQRPGWGVHHVEIRVKRFLG